MSDCEVLNCGYYYQNEDEDFPSCHFPSDDYHTHAPCEVDEDYESDFVVYDTWDDDDLETGFDPYEGNYTYDC